MKKKKLHFWNSVKMQEVITRENGKNVMEIIMNAFGTFAVNMVMYRKSYVERLKGCLIVLSKYESPYLMETLFVR